MPDSKTDPKKKPGSEQRQHYRIRYPLFDRPTFECQGKKYPIIDISEQGLAFAVPNRSAARSFTPPLTGRIVLKSGDAVTVSGKILRSSDDTVILLLKQGVPYALVMKEQRFLLQKYGQLGS